jgi:beta-lactamase superfamily II metal-dependent hydrolase
MKRYRFFQIITLISLLFCVFGCSFIGQSGVKQKVRCTLWQLPSQTHGQIMSYVLKTQNGKVIVIDGGNTGDACYLKDFLGTRGNEVHAWFISHPHPDHVGALTEILKEPGKLRIHKIYGSILNKTWISEYEPKFSETLNKFEQALNDSSNQVEELSVGEVLKIDGGRIDILSVKNPEIVKNAINNSSVVMKITDSYKSILFTGDLGVEGGRKLLASPLANQLKSDYVQMAHHGQNGVEKSFYQKVQPRYCLWPTPRWLWDNDRGKGKNSGPWKTLEVRGWMNDLKVEKHYISADGLHQIK